MHDLSLLHDLVIIFAVAIGVVLLLARVGLPSVAGLILAGALIGPRAIALVEARERVEVLSEVGVMLLLFSIGLELPFDRLRQLLKPMLAGGSLQVGLTGTLAFLAAYALGLSLKEALIVSFVLIPSSTAIVLRELDARGDLDAPHGKQSLGILLFQDICIVPMMLILSAVTSKTATGPLSVLGGLARSVLVLGLVVFVTRLAAPRLLQLVAQARKRDVFVLAVFVLSIGTAWLASLAGASLALGAFLAGVAVAGSDYRHQALGDVIPFREVFASLFFVSAGMLLDPMLLVRDAPAIAGLLSLVLLAKGAVVLATAALTGLQLRAAVLSAISLSQVGEFAVVLLEGVRRDHALGGATEARLLSVAILSMILTPLLMRMGPWVVGSLENASWLEAMFARNQLSQTEEVAHMRDHVIVAGYGVAGKALAAALSRAGVGVVIIDLNDALVRQAGRDGFVALYGDVGTPEVIEHVGVARARELVLLISDTGALQRTVGAVRRSAPDVVISVRTRYEAEIPSLRALGADHIVAAEVAAGTAIAQAVLQRSEIASAT